MIMFGMLRVKAQFANDVVIMFEMMIMKTIMMAMTNNACNPK